MTCGVYTLGSIMVLLCQLSWLTLEENKKMKCDSLNNFHKDAFNQSKVKY